MGIFSANRVAIGEYAKALSERHFGSAAVADRAKLVANALTELLSHTHSYEAGARLNIRWIGDSVIQRINNRDFSDATVSSILTFCARVFKERNVRDGVVPAGAAHDVLEFLTQGSGDELTDDEKDERAFVLEGIPRYIIFEASEDVRRVRGEADSAIGAWKSELDGLESRIHQHKEQLRRLGEEYNFVGLTKAFTTLLRSKKAQALRFALFLSLLACAALLPLIAELLVGHVAVLPEILYGEWQPDVVGKLVAFVGYEVIVLYFFRVILQQYYGLRAQILQLDLRAALCAFIEGYVDFLSSRKVGVVSEAMQRFESLTFAPIAPTESQVPNTLDGIDQLVKLIRQLKT